MKIQMIVVCVRPGMAIAIVMRHAIIFITIAVMTMFAMVIKS